MDHQDHVHLIQNGIPAPGGVWADFGSGWGAFTLALADLIGPEGEIYSVDKDDHALRRQKKALQQQFPAVRIHYRQADFTRRLDLPPLDGVVMANALHFVQAKGPTLRLIRSYLKPNGRLIIVEYNLDRGNRWVPYPLTFHKWVDVAREAGFAHTQRLATRPSRVWGEIYAAVSWGDEA